MPMIATHIEIRPNRAGQDRAFIDGTRVRVQDVAVMAEFQGLTPDQIVEALPHLSLAQVHAALSYYFDHRADIQRELRADEDFVQMFRQQSPASILDRAVNERRGPSSDAVSS